MLMDGRVLKEKRIFMSKLNTTGNAKDARVVRVRTRSPNADGKKKLYVHTVESCFSLSDVVNGNRANLNETLVIEVTYIWTSYT